MNIVPAIEPVINSLNAPFWEAAERNEFVLPWCTSTEQFFWPPGPVSPFDLDARIAWRPAERTGRLVTAVVFRRSYLKALEPIMPYAVGLVELDAGPRLQVHVRDTALAAPDRAGARVRIEFEGLLPDSRPVPVAFEES